jgi:hypothetical protein
MGDECFCKNRDGKLDACGEISIHSEQPQGF